MSRRHRTGPQLDLDDLPTEVRAALEAAIAGNEITLARSGRAIGSLEFRSVAIEGAVIDVLFQPAAPVSIPDGVTVVATAMTLSDTARRRLSDEFGDGYIVMDFAKAPTSTDVLLTPHISPQLLGHLRHQFPNARIVITEIEDEGLGVHYSGPVSRLLDAGASAYLPPRPIAELAANVHAYLTTHREKSTLESAKRPHQGLPSLQQSQIGR
jgi:hypothetical protein